MNVHGLDGSDLEADRQLSADLFDKDSKINMDDKFFKIKGSRKGERRDAILQHELGHQNLHNVHPDNNTVEKKNRTPEVHKNVIKNSVKDATGIDISKDSFMVDHDTRKSINDQTGAKKYFEKTTRDKDQKKERNSSLDAAKKFENHKNHQNGAEFEADRYAANHTSDRAVRNMIKDVYLKQEKDLKSGKCDLNVDPKKSKEIGDIDKSQRLKALKDKEIRNGKAYK